MLRVASEGKSDSAMVYVIADTGSTGAGAVSTVTVAPSPVLGAMGDSLSAYAGLRNASGVPITGRTVTWSVADTTVARITFQRAQTVLLRALKAGSTTLTATSEGKVGGATITIHRGRPHRLDAGTPGLLKRGTPCARHPARHRCAACLARRGSPPPCWPAPAPTTPSPGPRRRRTPRPAEPASTPRSRPRPPGSPSSPGWCTTLARDATPASWARSRASRCASSEWTARGARSAPRPRR
ncbi:MAG: Ig-like domain-containing protein [Gemmatimonadetes bacterium]|nr:Ig-like domain-containing protein [Gemmatimonadota bacterium]